VEKRDGNLAMLNHGLDMSQSTSVKEQCLNCLWFLDGKRFLLSKQVEGLGLGVCRRMPPIAGPERVPGQSHDDARYATWPIVYEDDYCGEHKNKKKLVK